ncbi:hypothetical protein VP01_1303g2 [Puccinia sorghi]|uniref:Uncharacterized protein n=1 Tax=Puccinia sorghi TaxID=27349 RepID=A0A0L6VN35_9BASI|nr:hypothetical protein VP01_1303g2 [Puccinia sorghi]
MLLNTTILNTPCNKAIGVSRDIEPPIPVIDIHNVWDVFSSILSPIKAYNQSWLSNPSNLILFCNVTKAKTTRRPTCTVAEEKTMAAPARPML